MSTYREALFEAFVWSQAVEESVGDLVRKKTDVSDRSVGRASFYRLIEHLKPHVESSICEALHQIRKDRNHVVHRSSYITNILAAAAAPEFFEDDIHHETARFLQIRRDAGDLLGYLVDEIVGPKEKASE